MSKKLFEADSINTLYLKLIKEISQNPEYITFPRGLECKEILNVTIRLTQPKNCLTTLKARHLNYAFTIIEKLEYLSGRTNPNRMIFYNSNYKSWLNELEYFDGAYPDRLQYWYIHIYHLLKKDRDTRQAVMTIYGPQDRHLSKDIACTCTLQFLIRNNKLFFTVYMRSQDLLWGFPYDVNAFCFLQEAMAAVLNIELGTFTLHVGSEHLYTERETQLLDILDSSNIHLNIKNPSFDAPLDFYELRTNLELFWYLEDKMRRNKLKPSILKMKNELLFPLEKYFDILWAYKLKKEAKGSINEENLKTKYNKILLL